MQLLNQQLTLKLSSMHLLVQVSCSTTLATCLTDHFIDHVKGHPLARQKWPLTDSSAFCPCCWLHCHLCTVTTVIDCHCQTSILNLNINLCADISTCVQCLWHVFIQRSPWHLKCCRYFVMIDSTFPQGNNVLARRASGGMCAFLFKREVINPYLCFVIVPQ